jgi:hypothetical protein
VIIPILQLLHLYTEYIDELADSWIDHIILNVEKGWNLFLLILYENERFNWKSKQFWSNDATVVMKVQKYKENSRKLV